MQFNSRRLPRRSVAGTRASLRRVAKRKVGGEAETLADDPCFRLLLATRIANAAREPRDPHVRKTVACNIVGSVPRLPVDGTSVSSRRKRSYGETQHT